MESYVQLILADDDEDDCLLFREALSELSLNVRLTIVNDGEALMRLLYNLDRLPRAVVLDLNMPKKTGFECLDEMQSSGELKSVPVFILSTSVPDHLSCTLKKKGARDCFQKPSNYNALKDLILNVVNKLERESLQYKVKSDDEHESS
jgi:CheY-like chemotaxis protein